MRETLGSVKTVWLRPGTRLGFFTHMGTQFSVTVFALMWGVPYLTVAQGVSSRAAGTLLTVSVVSGDRLGGVIGIVHRTASASTLAAGAGDHRQQRRWSGRSCSPCPARHRSGCSSCWSW